MKNLLVLLLLVTQVSFAEITTSNIVANFNKATPAQGGASTVCDDCGDLAKIKLACTNPGAVHMQIPPSDVKVFCHEEFCKWGFGPSKLITKTNYKSACGKIMTNKPGVSTLNKCKQASCDNTTFNLPNLEEKCGKLQTVYQITCDQVIAMTTVEDFCLNALDKEIAIDSSIVDMTPSGRTQTAVMGPEVDSKKPATLK